MAVPLPVVALALAGGGVVILYGTRSVKTAFGATPATSATSTAATAGGTGASGSGTVATGGAAAGMSANQKAFAGELQAKTGLNPAVIAAWMAAEEPVGANAGYAGTQDWLNVGITDSGPLGAGNTQWTDPVAAADATAAWIAGTWSDPGFGTASSGIQAILHTVGQSAAAQIAAIQGSGWASGGYPDLQQLYQEMVG
jgi:hypothetical protein